MTELIAQVSFMFALADYPDGYRVWLGKLLADWIRKASGKKANLNTANDIEWGHGFAPVDEEGGLADLWLGEMYIPYCKMYIYDGGAKSATWHNDYQPWYGVLFRDHNSPDDIAKVYALANSFEDYLKVRRISYQRLGYRK